MKIRAICFRIFENERGFNDYQKFPRLDREFEDSEDCVRYLDAIAETWSNGEECFLFQVELVE